jgi:putative addiction module component (TIGR02574 family)
MTKEQIIAEAKKLDWEDREAIVEQLVLARSSRETAEIDAAWAAEAKRRIEAVERGELKTVPGEQVLKEAYELLHQLRQR